MTHCSGRRSIVSFFVYQKIDDMAVETGNTAGANSALHASHQLGRPLLFLHLFGDEPMHENLGGIIFGGKCGFKHRVDAASILLLHGLHQKCHLKEGLEGLFRRGKGRKCRFGTAINEMLDNFPGMLALFPCLPSEERCTAHEIL